MKISETQFMLSIINDVVVVLVTDDDDVQASSLTGEGS